ncbi:mechanosensitive ion channel domain-containing protein [Amphritea pacifica]|uniref:mechanosensitive ion channel domain-containing protein n=1 Tax=Amphritea pacifica TaxID=2811233 RepID=UPI0019666FC6|nr:mechanosensitive ion channel domain-containing protein [Amphritea pacifica]MBN1008631.1 mechanosensitive ion channel [Amphritea pacifica]
MRLLSIFLLLFSLNGLAESPDLNADLTRLQSQLQQFEKDPENPLNTIYQQTAQHIQEIISQRQQAKDLRVEIEAQPQQLQQARNRPPHSGAELPETLPPATELQPLLIKTKAGLIDLEKYQDELQQTIRDSDKLLLSKREKQSSLQQQLNSPLSSAPAIPPTTELQKAREQLRIYQQMATESALEVTELEILALPGRTELASLNLKSLQNQIQDYKVWINTAEERLQQQSRASAEKTLSQLESADTDNNPVLQQALTRNNETADIIRQGLAETEQTAQRRKQLEQQLQIIRQTYQAIQLQLELGIGYTGSEIRKHIQQLPKPLKSDITRTRLKELRLNQLTLSQPPVEAQTEGLTDAQKTKLSQLQQSLNELISEQRTLQQKLISELSQLLLIQEQFNAQITASRALFNKHLLWLPSTEPVSAGWPAQIINGFIDLSAELPALLKPYRALLMDKVTLPSGLFLAVLPFALFCRRYLNKRQPKWCSQIGNVSQDHISHTLRPLLYGPLATLPIPLFLYVLGRKIGGDEAAVRNLLYMLASISWLYLTIMLWLQQPHGLLQGQFSLPEHTTATLRKRLSWLFWINTPLIAFLMLLDLSTNETVIAGPTRLILLLITIGFTLFWISLWRATPHAQHTTDGKLWNNISVWIGAVIAFNVTMAGMILWGYILSAGILIGLMFLLVCIAILAYLIFHLGRRWLLIEERKLLFAQTLARRAEILSAREEQKETPPPLKENFVDLQTISEQGNMLLKTVTALIFLTLAWFTLGWTLPALEALDSVTLWSTGSNDSGVLSFITLKQIIFALAALTVTFIAARNLPGLFELLVLNYLPLAPGTSFAVSTLLKYSLYIIGLISFLNFLGLEWSKLQWLVAALGVGLGFGLQEIVANFVSGLIILFEKPVRIGDTVTIGGVSGNVSRIQIRATTITDWDRKEVIIPNKTFITDQLINWSLTDAITRIVIPVGVAYGSDTPLVTKLLLQAAADNKHVLTEPAPLAFFLAFGNSTLDFELRAHISSMDIRNQTVHELHSAIDRLFREHNIEIAFPQMDLHLRSNDTGQPPDKDDDG